MKTNKHQTGFSIVELMVGILISMLVALAVAGTAQFLDAQKRMTVGVNGSLETLTLVSNTLSSDIKMAGFGLTYSGEFACEKASIKKNGVTANTDPTGFLPPIELVDGGEGLSDTLRIVYADSPFGSTTTTTSVELGQFTKPSYNAGSNASTIVDYAAPFNTTESVAGTEITGLLTYDGDACAIMSYNGANGMSTTPDVTVPIGSKAVPISDFQDITYRVENGKLIMHDNFVNGTAGDQEVAEGVVFMKVYGLVAGTWFKASDLTPYNHATPLSTQLTNTAPTALKLFLVVRDQSFNKKVNGACTATTQASLDESLPWYVAGEALAPAVDLTGYADWDCYKYKAVEFVVPLKNLILGSQA